MAFSTIPSNATLKSEPFKAHVSDAELSAFTQLLKLSPLGPVTHENTHTDVKDFRGYGITHEWLANAKKNWESHYNWRDTEARINSFPNFTARIEDNGEGFSVHYVALFSKKADAVPLLLLHGWPGSFLEFLDVVDLWRNTYNEENLPFHVIVPSLPGYGYSSGPPVEKNFKVEDIARVMDKLMKGLGFEKGYVAQGGDIGSFVARVLGVEYDSCKAVHLDMGLGANGIKEHPVDTLPVAEQMGLGRMQDFNEYGSSYASEHGTRPATIGLVLSSSPLAQLAWIGEKFLQWTDESPPLAAILDSVTLYWFTQSFARGIYPYRQFYGIDRRVFHGDAALKIKKPLGYSWYGKEIGPTPVKWVATSGDLVWSRNHADGGHFKAMEKPKYFVKDMEEFIGEAWPKAKL